MHELIAFGAEQWETPVAADNQSAGGAAIQIPLGRRHAALAGCVEPFDLLRPECCVPPLVGRTEELAALRCWLRDPAPMSVFRIVGRAGTGKTRLAIELCRHAEAEGWSAGFATADAPAEIAAEPGWARPALLVVIDGPGAGDGLATACRARLAGAASPGEKRRLLMLGRQPVDQAVCGAGPVDAGGPGNGPQTMRLQGLASAADRQVLLGRAMALAARLAGLPVCPAPGGAALDTGEPLHLLMAAVVAPHSGVVAALARSPASLAAELAMTERARLQRFAWQQRLDPALVLHLVACITLQDGCCFEAAPGLVRQEAEAMGMQLAEPAEHVADALADVLLAAGGRTLEPLGPAPVGEAFLAAELAQHAPEPQAAIIQRALHRAGPATAAILWRTAALHGDDDSTHPALAWSRQAGA